MQILQTETQSAYRICPQTAENYPRNEATHSKDDYLVQMRTSVNDEKLIPHRWEFLTWHSRVKNQLSGSHFARQQTSANDEKLFLRQLKAD